MEYPFATVDVFTEARFGGNPLAVFHDAAGLTDHEMQALAAELNLSETTFVLPPNDPANSARVRIFNRTDEMDFAGHPNVGTAYVLAQQLEVRGKAFQFEQNAGLVTVRLITEKRIVVGAEISAPQPLSILGEFSKEEIAGCVGLQANQIGHGHPPLRASVGTDFVVCEVAPDALATAAPDLGSFRELVATYPNLEDRLSVLLYAKAGNSVRARMFAPLVGTWEDPATGSAHAALAALRLFLCPDQSLKNLGYEAVQGVEMGRPSRIFARAWRTADGIRASVAGKCVPVLSGSVSL